MIKLSLSLALISVLFSACSLSPSVKPERTVETSIVSSKDLYYTMHNDFEISSDKARKLNIYSNRSFVKHGIIWYFGPNPVLSKDDIKVLVFSNQPTLYQGFGLKHRIKFFMSKLYGLPETDLEQKARKVGFDSFESFFDNVYNTFAASYSKEEFDSLVKKLGGNISDKTSELQALYFQSYSKKGIDPANIVLPEKIRLSKEDFQLYALTMDIAYKILSEVK